VDDNVYRYNWYEKLSPFLQDILNVPAEHQSFYLNEKALVVLLLAAVGIFFLVFLFTDLFVRIIKKTVARKWKYILRIEMLLSIALLLVVVWYDIRHIPPAILICIIAVLSVYVIVKFVQLNILLITAILRKRLRGD
jgi:hypothetical protein